MWRSGKLTPPSPRQRVAKPNPYFLEAERSENPTPALCRGMEIEKLDHTFTKDGELTLKTRRSRNPTPTFAEVGRLGN
ncbi:hypothetical protein BHE74_00011782 [Ensete ventricosum]|nr:hypothetical protein GW17_00056650 [Ensete ventricosum]RWW79929.1 hypothetical protein BHE74_00011782 [Ensete ventricosum]RZR78732.1 hypothetical protein BHM03_00004169 [Ensete ventricosum]